MKSLIKYIIFSLVFISCNSTVDKEKECIEVIREDIADCNCFVEGRDKFVSLFFSRIKDKTIVQMSTHVDRPYLDNTVSYYKQVGSYIFVCSGFCEEFQKENGFAKWDDSLNTRHLGIDHYLSLSDTFYSPYKDALENYIIKSYEYKEKEFIHIESISDEEAYIISVQADSFNIGFLPLDVLPE